MVKGRQLKHATVALVTLQAVLVTISGLLGLLVAQAFCEGSTCSSLTARSIVWFIAASTLVVSGPIGLFLTIRHRGRAAAIAQLYAQAVTLVGLVTMALLAIGTSIASIGVVLSVCVAVVVLATAVLYEIGGHGPMGVE